MNTFFSEIIRIARHIASDPSSGNEIIMIWLSILAAATATVYLMGKTLRSTLGDSLPRAAVITVVSTAVLVAGLAITNLYLIPLAGPSGIRGLLPGSLAVIIVAGISAPVCLWLHKTKYSKALVTVLLSIACSSGAVMVIRAGFTAARSSKASAIQMKSSTEKAGNLLK